MLYTWQGPAAPTALAGADRTNCARPNKEVGSDFYYCGKYAISSRLEPYDPRDTPSQRLNSLKALKTETSNYFLPSTLKVFSPTPLCVQKPFYFIPV